MQEDKLRHLLGLHLHGRMSAAETEELNALLQDESNEALFISLLTDMMATSAGGEDYDPVRWEAVRQRILDADAGTPVVPLRRTWWKWAAAAVVAGLLAVGGLKYFGREQEKLPPAAVSMDGRYRNDVPPGGNHATLLLANGQEIVLDTAAEGKLAQQGGTRISKLQNGQLAYNDEHSTFAARNVLTTPRGGQYRLTLSDGTNVWLNAASVLRYPTAFVGPERVVELTGEAYFEVAKDASRPFVVKTDGGTDVKVTGTHFNVSAYEEQPAQVVTLLEGAVTVNQRQLEPGQQAVSQNGTIRISPADTEQAVAWKNGFFSFSDADIKTVMQELERWYDVKIKYEANVSGLRFGGGMQRSLPLTSVLKILERYQVKFKVEGRVITVIQ
ncbi:FecR family protein [Chitinophaga caseinilytica]|uniref:FecR domain-containing protein n=1 Tax=Chitinophaga caseinilytica TaxID=2267521 RepID=A0ABZ2Z302_9BACT